MADTEDGGGGDPEPGGGFYFSSWHLGNDGGTDAWNGLSNWGNSGYGDLINPDDIASVGQGSIVSFLAYMSAGGSVSSYVNYANGKGPTPYLTNNSKHTIYFKPETDMFINGVKYDEGGSYALAPGQIWYYPIDGIAAPHLRKGEVYKVNNGISAIVNNEDINISGRLVSQFFTKVAGGAVSLFNLDSFESKTGGWKSSGWLRELTTTKINYSWGTGEKNIFQIGANNWNNLFFSSGLNNAKNYQFQKIYYGR